MLEVSTQDKTFPGGLCHPEFLGGRDPSYKGKSLEDFQWFLLNLGKA